MLRRALGKADKLTTGQTTEYHCHYHSTTYLSTDYRLPTCQYSMPGSGGMLKIPARIVVEPLVECQTLGLFLVDAEYPCFSLETLGVNGREGFLIHVALNHRRQTSALLYLSPQE